MRSIHVTRSIPAPPEAVFDLLTDHANYDRFRGIDGSELLRDGDPSPNGVGALRRIRARPFRFDEEVTAYSPVIIAEATTSLKRLSVSEAVMELDLTGAPVVVFRHASDGRVNLVYRRLDGNVGWVDPPGNPS